MKHVDQFKVVAMSTDFFEQFKKTPEYFDASFINIDGNVIAGSKILLISKTIEEIIVNLPKIIAKLPRPINQHHVIVLQINGECNQCRNDGEICPHINVAIDGYKEVLCEIDTSKIPLLQN